MGLPSFGDLGIIPASFLSSCPCSLHRHSLSTHWHQALLWVLGHKVVNKMEVVTVLRES